MSDLKITCPTCSTQIELTEQLAGPLVADLKTRFQDQLAQREAQAAKAVAEAEARARAAGKAEAGAEQKALQERVKEQDEKLRAAAAGPGRGDETRAGIEGQRGGDGADVAKNARRRTARA